MSYAPIELKMRTAMLAFGALTALVGTNIYAYALPQSVMNAAPPVLALTVERTATRRQHTHSGISQLSLARLRVTCWAKGASSEMDTLVVLKTLVDFLNQFQPPGTPAPRQNLVLNESITAFPATQPPMIKGVLDVQIWNREDL